MSKFLLSIGKITNCLAGFGFYWPTVRRYSSTCWASFWQCELHATTRGWRSPCFHSFIPSQPFLPIAAAAAAAAAPLNLYAQREWACHFEFVLKVC